VLGVEVVSDGGNLLTSTLFVKVNNSHG
jgi:hypothetical protein